MKPTVPRGWTGRLLVVGEAPGRHEDEVSGRPFTGPAGRLLWRLLRRAGYTKRDVALVNACRCRPPQNATPTMRQIRACRPFLLRVLHALRPACVVALGATALRAITNDGRAAQVTAARGRRLPVPGLETPPPVYGTYHPSAVLRGAQQYEHAIVADLQRASWPEISGPEDRVPAGSVLAVDTEFALPGTLLTLAVASPEHARASDVADDWAGREELLDAIRGATTICGHHLGADLDHLVKLGVAKDSWLLGDNVWDSYLLARLQDENLGRGAYRLERVFLARHNFRSWKEATEQLGHDAAQWPPQERKERCRLDAWASAVLVRTLASHVPAGVARFVHRVAAVLHRIGLAGITIDREALDESDVAIRTEMERLGDILQRHAFRAGCTEFSPTNDRHVRDLLFRRLKLPVLAKTTRTKQPAVDKTVLTKLAEERKVAAWLLMYRRARKLYSTYVQGVRAALQDWPHDERLGWLPVQLHALGARTGRRSSGRAFDAPGTDAPNLQNWPSCKASCAPKCPWHPKRLVVSRFHGGLIANYDYKSLEPFILAWLAQDEALFRAFAHHGGYIYFGETLFGKTITKDTPEYTALKGTILGTHYGAGEWQIARLLWERVNVRLAATWERHLARVKELRRRYLDAVPNVRRYMQERRREVLKTQQVVGLLGRVRHLPHPFAKVPERGTPEWKRWKHIANEAINYPVQWGAACVTGAALIDVEQALLRAYGLSVRDWHQMLLDERAGKPPAPVSRIVNEVHDALVVDLHPDYAERDAHLVASVMVELPTLKSLIPDMFAARVPLRLAVDKKIGERWT